ncbi:hypothetical protein [Streptomyces sp. NPDC051554]|uniref:hypothetical protein n=1 Tax=Streptomyces sp. NPDC051554 TaxID=3365656 RepID=UPI0037AC14A5
MEFGLNFKAPYSVPGQANRTREDAVMLPSALRDSSIAISVGGDVTMSRLQSFNSLGNVKARRSREFAGAESNATAEPKLARLGRQIFEGYKVRWKRMLLIHA